MAKKRARCNQERGLTGKLYTLPVMECAAIVIALCSLAVSGWIALESHRMNRLSVKPSLAVYFHYKQLNSAAMGDAGFKYWNTGVGPAEIKYLRVSVDNQYVDSWKEMTEYLGIGSVAKVEITTPPKGYYLPPGDPVDLFYIYGDADYATALYKNSERITIELCYCSVFGDCWLVDNALETDLSESECEFNGRNMTRVQ